MPTPSPKRLALILAPQALLAGVGDPSARKKERYLLLMEEPSVTVVSTVSPISCAPALSNKVQAAS